MSKTERNFITAPEEVKKAHQNWLSIKRHHTCTCSHVEWAHWDNGTCGHCVCNNYDGKPDPLSVWIKDIDNV